MYGINSKLQSSILTNGENDFNLSQLLNISTHGNDEEIQELLKNKSLNPNMYGPPNMPPSWNFPHGITSFVDAPKHLAIFCFYLL